MLEAALGGLQSLSNAHSGMHSWVMSSNATYIDRMCSMSAFTSSSLVMSVLQKVQAAAPLPAPAPLLATAPASAGVAGAAALPLLLSSGELLARRLQLQSLGRLLERAAETAVRLVSRHQLPPTEFT